MNLKTQKAFSLIELMVTISIVAVMAAVGLVTFSTVQRTGRDAQRKSDLRMLQSAIQQFYADFNHYPNVLTLTAGAPLNNCTGEGCSSVTKTYLSTTPRDPISGTTDPYCYTSFQTSASGALSCAAANFGTCHYYELCARLENPSGTAATCTCDAQNNFRITPL